MQTVAFVVEFVVRTSVRFAPLFFLSIALAAIVKALPIAATASRWLARREHASVAAGTALGAFSPFCSCTVVPVVRSLLVAGAPLAGVMAFWVASPLMDPEIFVLSVGLLGWDMAVARLVAALALALLAGFGAIIAIRRGWLREYDDEATAPVDTTVAADTVASVVRSEERVLVGVGTGTGGALPLAAEPEPTACGTADGGCDAPATPAAGLGMVGTLRALDWREVVADMRSESWKMGRWILFAFVLEALILRFVPQEALVQVLGTDAPWAVPLAALLGVPLYLDNFSALPIISGLLQQGMAPGAAIAFLLAGPVTTIPAMTAVRAVLPGPVFRYYLAVSIGGSMLVGWLVGLVLG